jgi:hypothetical protein
VQLTPPEGAVLGERVRFGDMEAPQKDADTPNRCRLPRTRSVGGSQEPCWMC